MTNREALQVISENLAVAIHDADGINPEYEYEQVKALDMAYDAIEKQIPKKPIRTNRAIRVNGCICMLDENEFWKCPNNHGAYDVPLEENQKYCHECGQAIDWSDKQ